MSFSEGNSADFLFEAPKNHGHLPFQIRHDVDIFQGHDAPHRVFEGVKTKPSGWRVGQGDACNNQPLNPYQSRNYKWIESTRLPYKNPVKI